MSQKGGGKGREVGRLIRDFIYLYLFCLSVQKTILIFMLGNISALVLHLNSIAGDKVFLS